MLKRLAVIVALGTVMLVAEVEAARRGGCPNGQCSMSYQPAAKVAVQSAPAPTAASQVADAQTAEQPQYVASQPTRRYFFRRWSR